MSLVNTGCILIQKAEMDAYVKYQVSVLAVEQGRLEKALSPGLHVVCGTRFLSVSRLLPKKMLCILRRNLIRSWPSTRIYLDVVGLATHMTEMFTSQILYATITEM